MPSRSTRTCVALAGLADQGRGEATMSTTYRGFGLEIYADRTDVVRWGVAHGTFPSVAAARAYVDDLADQA